MKARETLRLETSPIDPLTAAEGFGGFLPTIFIAAAAGAIVFGLLASGSGEPLLLTVIALLAMLGMFLLFGIAAGHIRIGARLAPADLLKAASDTADEPQIIAQADGTVIYSNAALDQMFGRHGAGPLSALEAGLSGDAEAVQALFRLDAGSRAWRDAPRGRPLAARGCDAPAHLGENFGSPVRLSRPRVGGYFPAPASRALADHRRLGRQNA